MRSILIWIHSATNLDKKILKLKKCLDLKYEKVIFVSHDNGTCEYFKKKGLYIFSIEDKFAKFVDTNVLNYPDFYSKDININILNNIFLLGAYKKSFLPNHYKKIFKDPYSEFVLLVKFWNNVIQNYTVEDVLILNGMSIASFSLAYISSEKNLKFLFWENGLLPNSLFFNEYGVNAFSKSNDKKEKEKIITLNSFEFNKKVNKLLDGKKRILITLQVDNDSNIKLFSQFFSNNDLISYVDELISKQFNKADLRFKVRKHPKSKLNLQKFIKNKKKFFISKNSSFLKDLESSDLVITINSTTGLETIIRKKPLICFGNSFYSKYLKKVYINHNGNKVMAFIYDPDDICLQESTKVMFDYLSECSINNQSKDKENLGKLEKHLNYSLENNYFINFDNNIENICLKKISYYDHEETSLLKKYTFLLRKIFKKF